MNSNLLSVPCSFMIALLVAKTGLVALNLPVDIGWLTGAVAVSMLLLYKRNLVELGLITALAVLAETYSQTGGDAQVSPDVLLSVLITIIILPLSLDIMGIAQPVMRPLLRSN
jgi:hypothetical protein